MTSIQHGYKQDWFVLDREIATPLFEVPGLAPDRKPDHYVAHRSHLALLDDDRSARALREIGPKNDLWEERDQTTERLGFKLKTVQHQAVDFIRSRRGTLLGDEMRVGKTLAAAYSHDPALGKLVVVAPLMVRAVWLSWLKRIWPGEDIGIMVGKVFDPEQANKSIVFGHYDVIYNWQSGNRIGTLILDEAHVLTNRNTRRSRAAILLASCAERVIAATGTPVWNMPSDLWNLLSLVAPGAFGGYHEFCQRYAKPEPTPYGNKYTGVSNGEELSKRLSEVMIRRRWVDVEKDLLPITRNVLTLDLSLADRRKLDIRAESLRKSEKTNTAAELARYREALSHLKLDLAVSKAKEISALGEPGVLWCWHRETADQLVDRLIAEGVEALTLHGDIAVNRREKVIDHWRSLPNAALVVTMSVAQVGIDLSHSHLPVFVEIDYTPAMVSQAEMRTFKPGRAMSITYIVADHFADRKIAQALIRKLEAAGPVDLGTGEGAISSIERAFRGEVDEPDLERFMADLLS
jgi:SNF2 family DNA or RNA helicase